jgi:hypothetical protein
VSRLAPHRRNSCSDDNDSCSAPPSCETAARLPCRCNWSSFQWRKNDEVFQSFLVSSGTAVKRSATSPTSATLKMGASLSLLMATMHLLAAAEAAVVDVWGEQCVSATAAMREAAAKERRR